MHEPTALSIAELLDDCIAPLRQSPRDLMACALVSRRWVFAAQRQLFRALTITNISQNLSFPPLNDTQWARLQATLEGSPHLIRHIRTFMMVLTSESLETLVKICRFPFTHLESVAVVHTGALSSAHALAFQQLLSLPTLRHLDFHSGFNRDPTCMPFMRIWDRCSSGIRRLVLAYNGTQLRIPRLPDHDRPVVLESLRMASKGSFDSRLLQKWHRFDLSQLKMLSVCQNADVPWDEFAPRVQSIEALDIVPKATSPPVDPSLFPSLAYLRLRTPFLDTDLSPILDVLALIRPTSGIRKITFVLALGALRAGGNQLDAAVCKLSEPLPEVEVVIRPHEDVDLAAFLPQLHSKKLVGYFLR
ncbi:hypothetical protein DFH06DRAFT_1320855 [Mycena polygramma]|nr:hypothetical protein DFH06DRAFT_1320855 [Mycena polygramma]